jgi:hypothetical protein
MLDKIGQEIVVGSWIAYGHALGRCAGLRIGKVLKLKEEDNKDYFGKINEYCPKIYRITVQGIDDDWKHNEPHLCNKGTLQFPERIIVLADWLVPSSYKNLIKE